jgi:MFS family permease
VSFKKLIKVSHQTNIFVGLSSFQILAMFRRGLFYTYLSIYLRFFLGLSVTETTLFATIPMILNIFFQMSLWGFLSDKFQLRRTLIIIGEILAGIGTLSVFVVHRIVPDKVLAGYVIILGLSIVEIFWSMSNTGWTALVSDLYPYRQRNTIQGRLASIGGLGRIFGVWIGGILYDGLKLQYEGWGFYEGPLFIIPSLIMFLSTIPMFFMPEGGITNNKIPINSESDKEIESMPVGANVTHLFIIFLVAMMFLNFGRNSIAIIFSQYLFLDSGFAVSSEMLSYIINLQSLAIIVVGLFVGWIGTQLNIDKTLILGAGVSIIALLLISLTDSLLIIFVASFLRGTSDVIIRSSAYAFASKLIPPRNRAKFFGIYNATFFLSWGLAGTILAGPITDYLISVGALEVIAYQTAFLASAFVTTIGLLILLILLIKIWLQSKI